MPLFHACLIGISEYAESPGGRLKLSSLDGAATGACIFADYLLDGFRPPNGEKRGSVRLLLSPTHDEELELAKLGHAAGKTYEVASSENVEKALEDWASDCDQDFEDVAIMYIAGHGVVTGTNGRWVFLKDAATRKDPYRSSISLDQIRRRMAKRRAGINYFLFDACASSGNKVPRRDDDSNSGLGLSDPDPDNERTGRLRQYELWTATHNGTSNYITTPRKGPLLSRALLDLMKRDGGEFLPIHRKYVITKSGIAGKFQDRARAIGHADGLADEIFPVIMGEHHPAGITTPSEGFPFKLTIRHTDAQISVNVRIVTPEDVEVADETVTSEDLVVPLPEGYYNVEINGPARNSRILKMDRDKRLDPITGVEQ